MNEVIPVIPPASIRRRQLGFLARSISVENPTNAWYYLPDEFRFIPPNTHAMTITLAHGSEVADIVYQAPAGITQNATVNAGATATFTYSDEPAVAQSGVQGSNYAGAQEQAFAITPTVTGFPTYLTTKAVDKWWIQLRSVALAAARNPNQLIITLTYPSGAQHNELISLANNLAPVTIPFAVPIPANTNIAFAMMAVGVGDAVTFALIY